MSYRARRIDAATMGDEREAYTDPLDSIGMHGSDPIWVAADVASDRHSSALARSKSPAWLFLGSNDQRDARGQRKTS
jgi:hypothetical protein